jgi:hypothetical protein
MQDGSMKSNGMSPNLQVDLDCTLYPFSILGGSGNVPTDLVARCDGTGCVCIMEFSNVQIITTKFEKTEPYIVLAHELIHSLHCLQGISADRREDEELGTTGNGQYADQPLTENAFRSAFGLPPRIAYSSSLGHASMAQVRD